MIKWQKRADGMGGHGGADCLGGIHSMEGLSSGRTGVGAGLIQTRGEPGILRGAQLLLSLGLPRDTGSQSSHPREAQGSPPGPHRAGTQADRQTDRQTEEATRKQRVVDTDPLQPALGWEAGMGRPGTASGILSGKGYRSRPWGGKQGRGGWGRPPEF